MASLDHEMTVKVDVEPTEKTKELIREIVREELAAWEKRLVQKARFGLPVNAETK